MSQSPDSGDERDRDAPSLSAASLRALEGSRSAASAQPPVEVARRPLFILRVRDTWLAVDAHLVEAVIPLAPCAAVPFAPDHFEGVVVHGDRVLTVVDLGRFLGLPSAAASSGFGRILVVHAAGMRAGLICDRATGVLEVDRSAPTPPRVLQGARLVPYVAAEVDLPFGLTALLDTNGLFAAMCYRE